MVSPTINLPSSAARGAGERLRATITREKARQEAKLSRGLRVRDEVGERGNTGPFSSFPKHVWECRE